MSDNDRPLAERLRLQSKQREKVIRIAVLGALGVAVLFPLVGTTFQIQLMTSGLITGIVAMSFSLLAGFGGMVSLAQMAFYGMAAYVVAIATQTYGLTPLLGIPLALGSSAVLSGLFGLIAIRSAGIYFLIMTLALSQMFYGIAFQWQSVTGGYNGITGIDGPAIAGISIGDTLPLYFITVVITALCYLALRWVLYAPFGLTLRGIRDRPARMRALGYRVQLHRWLLIVLSGVVAGVAGVLGLYYNGLVSPGVAGLTASILVILAALLGGVSTLFGAIFGGVVVTFLISFVSYSMQQWFGTSHYWTFIGVVFVMVVMYLPNGIFGAARFRFRMPKPMRRRA